MYDELIKRLKEDKSWVEQGTTQTEHEIAEHIQQAADAIEERCQQVDKFAAKAARLYAKLPKWIPVAERLPKDIDEEVLVCTEDYGVNELGFVMVATYGGNGWLDCWERKTYITAVTHWMPLPTPPTAEEGE